MNIIQKNLSQVLTSMECSFNFVRGPCTSNLAFTAALTRCMRFNQPIDQVNYLAIHPGMLQNVTVFIVSVPLVAACEYNRHAIF